MSVRARSVMAGVDGDGLFAVMPWLVAVLLKPRSRILVVALGWLVWSRVRMRTESAAL